MGVRTVNTFEIDDLLEQMVLEGREHFAPHYVCERLGIDNIESVADYLLSLSDKKVIPIFEVECPEGDSDFTVPSPTMIDCNEPRTCRICGIEYTPDPEKIWLAFDFTKPFIDHIKKKSKKHQEPCSHQVIELVLV